MPQLRQLVSGLSLWNPGMSSKSGHEGFVMVKVAMGQVCFQAIQIFTTCITPPVPHTHSFIYHPCHIILATDHIINPLKPELNPICYLLALLGAHHFLHVSRIKVKLLTFRLLMSYIYMQHPFLMFLDHTQRRSTVRRTPLDE